MRRLVGTWLVRRTDHWLVQAFRYFWVGGVAFAVDFGTFALLTKVVGVHYLLSNIFGFCCGLVTNYLLSVTWVFSSRKLQSRTVEFTLFAVIGIVGLGLNELILYVLHDRIHIEVLIAKIGATGAVLAWNFIARKLLLFA